MGRQQLIGIADRNAHAKPASTAGRDPRRFSQHDERLGQCAGAILRRQRRQALVGGDDPLHPPTGQVVDRGRAEGPDTIQVPPVGTAWRSLARTPVPVDSWEVISLSRPAASIDGRSRRTYGAATSLAVSSRHRLGRAGPPSLRSVGGPLASASTVWRRGRHRDREVLVAAARRSRSARVDGLRPGARGPDGRGAGRGGAWNGATNPTSSRVMLLASAPL